MHLQLKLIGIKMNIKKKIPISSKFDSLNKLLNKENIIEYEMNDEHLKDKNVSCI